MSKLLIVEDDESALFMLKQGLLDERYIVEATDNAEDALHLLGINLYDLIILDWELPKTSGLQLLQDFRGKGGIAPVLFLTGKDTLDDIEKGLDCGADDYLVKPFAWRELLSRVRALLRRNSVQKQSVLECGPITLDPATGVVTAFDVPVKLTAQDQSLLEFLMRHPDQVFSTESLLDRVWKTDRAATGSAVRTSFLRIRKALSIDGREIPIVNIRGIGYKIRK